MNNIKLLKINDFNLGMEGFYYDNGHPWIIYWSIHALFLLDHPDLNLSSPKLLNSILKFLKFCQSPKGLKKINIFFKNILRWLLWWPFTISTLSFNLRCSTKYPRSWIRRRI